jgi:hypothetical protein
MRNKAVNRHQTSLAGITSLALILACASTALGQEMSEPAAPPAEAPFVADDAAATPAPAPTPTPTPAPPAAPPTIVAAPAPDEARADVDAEISAIEQQVIESSSRATNDTKLDIYGFADMGYGIAIKKFAFGQPYDTFAVGNLNVYLASNLSESWRSLAEVRFTYLPQGASLVDATGQVSRVDTTVPDYTDLGRTARWGGVMIQRAYLEYQVHPALTIRGGHFLTPYGIWNVDHGSPVIIGVRRPFIIGESLLPQSQTGLELYGTYHIDPIQIGYHLTLSNGRGPLDAYQDLNGNKAIGGRLFARADTPAGTFTVGVSGYKGRYTDRKQEYVFDAAGTLGTKYQRVLDYNELSLAADLKWEHQGFLLQGEAIMNDAVYDRQRPTDPFVISGPPGYLPDTRRFGVYGLTGYRFGFLGTMPFAGAEYYDTGRPMFAGKSAAFFGGLNVRPTARVVLKAQYTYSWFPDSPVVLPKNSHYNTIDLQAAWSF